MHGFTDHHPERKAEDTHGEGLGPGKGFVFSISLHFCKQRREGGGGVLEAGREVRFRAVFCCLLASVTKDPAFWETSTFLDASQKPAQKIKSPLSRQNKRVKHQTKCSSPVAGEMAWWGNKSTCHASMMI